MAVFVKWEARSISEEEVFLIELVDNTIVDIWRVAQAERKREKNFFDLSRLDATLLAAYLYWWLGGRIALRTRNWKTIAMDIHFI